KIAAQPQPPAGRVRTQLLPAQLEQVTQLPRGAERVADHPAGRKRARCPGLAGDVREQDVAGERLVAGEHGEPPQGRSVRLRRMADGGLVARWGVPCHLCRRRYARRRRADRGGGPYLPRVRCLTCQSHGGGLCTQRPATIVATTPASRSTHGSRSSTTRSAAYPGRSLPRRRSSPVSHAGATVVASNACSIVTACSGCHAGRTSTVRRTPARMPARGSSSSIGASEPLATTAPVSTSERYA